MISILCFSRKCNERSNSICLYNYTINNESTIKEVRPYSNRDHMDYLSLSITIFISQPPNTGLAGNNASIDTDSFSL